MQLVHLLNYFILAKIKKQDQTLYIKRELVIEYWNNFIELIIGVKRKDFNMF